jgi:Helix-turn-helix domain
MKTSLRFGISAALVLIMGAACFGQRYTQTNLVSNTAGAAPVTDPKLINPWGLSRASGSPWWISDNATGFSTLYDGAGVKQSLVVTIRPGDPTNKNSAHESGEMLELPVDLSGKQWICLPGRREVCTSVYAPAPPWSCSAGFCVESSRTPNCFNRLGAILSGNTLKQLRLHEARRLMLVDGLDAGTTAFHVGYESATLFSREYRRLFGRPPLRDIKTLRFVST